MPRSRSTPCRPQSGQMLVLAAIGLVVFLGFLGLVIDVGRLYVVRQQLRNACDAGAGAGAPKLPMDPATCRVYAFQYYCSNAGGTPPAAPISDDTYYTVTGTGDVVKIRTPYGTGSTASKKAYVEARRTVRSVFMQLLGVPTTTVKAYAVGVLKGRTSYASLLAPNTSGRFGRTTQPLERYRSDGRKYALTIEANNLTLGLDADGDQVGIVVTSQNTYVDSNNSIGKAMYGDTGFANYGNGNSKTSPALLNPAPGASAGVLFLDPNPYITQATNQGHVYSGTKKFKNETVNGFYYVDGDIIIDKNVRGTATFAAKGRIFTTETGSNLTTADTDNKILFYAGCDPNLDPTTYFESAQFDPDSRYIHMNDNNCTYTGTIYAPYGHVLVESNQVTVTGTIVGDTLGITTYANNLTVNYQVDYSPPIAPGAVLLE